MRLFVFLITISTYFVFSFHTVFAADPSPAPLPTLPKTNETRDACIRIGKDAVYPPNSECYAVVNDVETNIDSYPMTCITAPEVEYEDTFTGYSAPFTVDVNVTHSFSDATLGGYGPDLDTMVNSPSPDNLAKNYLFNSLFDKPFYSLKDTPREAWRTYWRLLSA